MLAAVRTAMSPVEVSLCEGQGAAGRTARGVIVPRSNPAMMAGADLVAADAAWLYPLLLALDTGEELSDDVRKEWLQTAGII